MSERIGLLVLWGTVAFGLTLSTAVLLPALPIHGTSEAEWSPASEGAEDVPGLRPGIREQDRLAKVLLSGCKLVPLVRRRLLRKNPNAKSYEPSPELFARRAAVEREKREPSRDDPPSP